MPRYHFDIRLENGTLLRDDEGLDLPDVKSARQEALMVIAEVPKGCRDYAGCVFEVRHRRRRLFVVPLPGVAA